MAQEHRKTQLTAELERARRRVGGEFGALRSALDFPQRARNAAVKNPLAWVGGATLFGVLLSKLPARRGKIRAAPNNTPAAVASAGKAGLVLGALKIAFDLSRPALVKWATHRVSEYMESGRNDGRTPH